jgi:hypothetical protein
VETRTVPPPAARNRWESLTPAIIAGLAALLLFWGLTDKYLWQDEAATAVLAARMLKFGRPLAYDGVNLVTIDHFAAEDEATIDQRTGDPRRAVDYYIRRGDYKPDTTWKWQPWGQFVAAAAGIAMLGKTTLGARLPFALAGFATVMLLYRLVRKYCGSLPMAALAALLLLANAYWILHARQCRYYSLSSLFLMVTLFGYARWQFGGRLGAAAFVAAAWCWFQVDYGTVWPVFGVLFLDAFLARRRDLWRTAAVGAALAAAIAPFVYYYELWGRLSVQAGDWNDRFMDDLFNMNEYVAPALVVLAAAALLARRWKKLPEPERRLVAVACGALLALALWIPHRGPRGLSALRHYRGAGRRTGGGLVSGEGRGTACQAGSGGGGAAGPDALGQPSVARRCATTGLVHQQPIAARGTAGVMRRGLRASGRSEPAGGRMVETQRRGIRRDPDQL